MSSFENRLAKETSPYLLQHQHNPVNWYAWGAEAFTAAVAENKPIFLSIGYATCYWCHVMEKDSFESEEVAAVINQNFIPIKVDREERPDVDQIYMDAVVGLTGHGGWPMSVFLTPDKKPFWAGTFIKKEQFIQLMHKLSEIWNSDSQKIVESADSIVAALGSGDTASIAPSSAKSSSSKESLNNILQRSSDALLRNFDRKFGGFGPAPKFPPSQHIQTLLTASKLFSDERYLYAALTTLEEIGKRALFDHVEGGFHRYATDAAWEIPHFEKMLYDNALLIPAYVAGHTASGFEPFRLIAEKTADYLCQQMKTSDGLFMSAEDAGDVGKEGEYYVWDPMNEIKYFPADIQKSLHDAFVISDEGNFEQHQTLVARSTQKATSPEVTELYSFLQNKRAKRSRPLRDYKIITAWNGLALTAFASLAKDKKYLSISTTLAEKLTASFQTSSELPRLQKTVDQPQGAATIQGVLEDYTYVIEGLIRLYEVTFDNRWLNQAKTLQETQDTLFWDPKRQLFKQSAATDLITKKFDIVDNALPSTNATAYENLVFLSKAFLNIDWFQKSEQIKIELSAIAEKYPTGLSRFLLATTRYQKELIIVTNATVELPLEALDTLRALSPTVAIFIDVLRKQDLPAITSKGQTAEPITYFVCEDGVCQQPVYSLESALALF